MTLNGWTATPLGDIAPASSNKLPPAEAEVWNLSLDEIESKTGRVLKRTTCRVSDLGSSKCSFDTRHVLYSKLRPYLNKVVIPEEPGVGTSELIPMLPNPERLDREFLAYYLRSTLFLDFANENTRGANLPRIGMKELWKQKIPLPNSIDEQRRIVARIKECMERVEEIEGSRTENIKMAGGLYKSRLTDLYDEIALGSPLREFGDIVADTKLGLVRSKNEQSEDRTYPYVKMQNISNAGHLNLSNLTRVDANNKESETNRVATGDFLFNTRNSYELVGKTAIVPSHSNVILFNNNILRVRFKDVVLPSFVNHLFQHKFVRTQLDFRKNKTTSVCAIYWKMLATVKIPIPPLQVQQNFVNEMDCFKSLQMEIESEMRNCDKMSGQLRESILRKAFGGEL